MRKNLPAALQKKIASVEKRSEDRRVEIERRKEDDASRSVHSKRGKAVKKSA